jgi:hypothetical protein
LQLRKRLGFRIKFNDEPVYPGAFRLLHHIDSRGVCVCAHPTIDNIEPFKNGRELLYVA